MLSSSSRTCIISLLYPNIMQYNAQPPATIITIPIVTSNALMKSIIASIIIHFNKRHGVPRRRFLAQRSIPPPCRGLSPWFSKRHYYAISRLVLSAVGWCALDDDLRQFRPHFRRQRHYVIHIAVRCLDQYLQDFHNVLLKKGTRQVLPSAYFNISHRPQ